jgi:hypothetical protein
MKTFGAFLLPVLALADVTDVRVIGTTPTQAVLAYTAPDRNACTLAVSTSASQILLVHDVDPALFAGANADTRAGNISSGRARVFVVGKRSVEQDLTGNISSRALQAATLHYFQIACPSDGSTAAGSFTTQPIPAGVGASDPIPIDPANNGNYLYPTFSATDRTFSAIDPHTGALVKNMALAGDIVGVAPGMGSSGTGVFCQPVSVKASNENVYGYHCEINTAGASPGLYWVATTGEVRFLGVMRTSYNPPSWPEIACKGVLSAVFDGSDPNTFYCGTSGALVKGVYTGHTVSGQDVDLTGQAQAPLSGMPHTTWTLLLPSSRGIPTLLTEFDSNYATVGSVCCGSYLGGDWANNNFYFHSWGATQDTLGWLGEFDPAATAATQTAKFGSSAGCLDNPPVTGSTYAGQSGCVVASTGSFTGGQGSGLRWSVLHTFDVTPASLWQSITVNALKMKTSLSYQVTLSSALSGTPGTCTMAQPSGNPITNWPDTSWTMGCSRITVTGDPALNGTASTYPSSMPALPGDLISISSGSYNHYEILRLLDKGSDGNTWYVQRQYYYRTPDGGTTWCTATQIAGCTNLWPYSSVAAGGTLDMLSPAVYYNANTTGMQMWWDPSGGALTNSGATVIEDALPQGHAAYINNAAYGRWTYVNGKAVFGMEPARLLNPPAIIQMLYPKFNGVGGNALETHPSLSVSNPPNDDAYRQRVDNHPYYGDTSLATASTVSLVSGQLYRIRGTNVASNYKLIPYFANSGSRAMKEVSGPAALLATDSSTQFQWCVALNAGECYSGSQSGDVYFNAPGIANAYCTYNWTTLQNTLTIPNDICISPSAAVVQAVEMQEIANDPFGLQLRVISNALGKYDQQSVFWNSRTIPDGSWLFTSLAADPGSLKLIQIPPRTLSDSIAPKSYVPMAAPQPTASGVDNGIVESGYGENGARAKVWFPRQLGDRIDRTSYVPIAVPLQPTSGVDNAILEFGYAENGYPGYFYCTARQEACVAQGATVNASQPFYFATTEVASITGAPCGGGCTIMVPGLSGRILYYQITSRDSLGSTVTQQVGILPVP